MSGEAFVRMFAQHLDNLAENAYPPPTSMETLQLEASLRSELGRRAKTVRTTHHIPGVMYGHGLEPRPISVQERAFHTVYQKAGSSSLIDMNVGSEESVKVLIKDVQRDPLTMQPIHADFYQVRMDEEMNATIPLRFVGDSPAVRQLGGTLVKSLDAVDVSCLPKDLPHDIEVDLSVLATFDDDITLADLALPPGVTLLEEDLRTPVAQVQAPLTEEELKRLEESHLGDVTTVVSEADEKKAEAEAAAAAEASAEGAGKSENGA